MTQSTDNALAFLCEALRPQDDSLLIAVDRPTNRLAGAMNQKIQEWKGARARDLGILQVLTQLVTPTTLKPEQCIEAKE
jgi:hypothetical protein